MAVSGRKRVAKFIAAIASQFWTGVTLARIEANGQPAALISRNGEAVSVVTISASAQGIDQIMWIMSRARSQLFHICRYAHWSKRVAP
jgi:RNA polymerase sigma-70 factor (ECF subfamily)